MSLKAFHIVFITASTLLSFGFGVWAIREYFMGGNEVVNLVMGGLSTGAGVLLIVYGRYFLKKLRSIGYL
ncbi:MAG: hypothetical protein O2960_03120 [Verrucomicrobia bacterium]|nr:hypothetical protein [Verrucomicrobiota bacterium]